MRLDRAWIAAVLSLCVTTGAFEIGKRFNQVQFNAKTTAYFSVMGKAKGKTTGFIEFIDNTAKGKAILELKYFETGLQLRDEHLRTTLEVEKFPTAMLEFSGVAGKFDGTLQLHGHTKTVSGTYTVGPVKKLYFKIKLSEFDIIPPSFMGVTLENEIEIEASVK